MNARPLADVRTEDHGSLIGFRSLSSAGQSWLSDWIPDGAQWFGGAVMVERRYAADVVAGMIDSGLVVLQ